MRPKGVGGFDVGAVIGFMGYIPFCCLFMETSMNIFLEITSCYKKNDLERVDAIVGKNRGFLYRDSIYRVKK